LANQERVFESRDHHNAKWAFTSQDHQLTKISPILQAWFLYSVNFDNYESEMVTALDFGIISDQEIIR